MELFLGILGAVITAAILWAAKSIHDSAIVIAVLVKRVEINENRLNSHSDRIRNLEMNQQS